MKKFIFCLLIAQSTFAQEKPIILWDLHDVLLERQNVFKVLAQYPHFGSAITHISWPLIKEVMALVFTRDWDSILIEELIQITRKYDNLYLEDLILHITNAQKPKKSMDLLVYELAALGYPQHIGSNIGSIAFSKLIDSSLHPELAPLFAHLDIAASQISKVTPHDTIKKPDKRYYQEYLAKNNLNPHEYHIIFVDNSKENIATARSLGFDTIYFKHPHQARNEFRLRGINVAKPPYTISDQKQAHRLYNPLSFYRGNIIEQ